VSIAQNLRHHHTIVTKSTVPIGTGFWLGALIEDIVGPGAREQFGIVSNPEFLREGSAVQDFLHPDRVVLGSDDQRALGTAVNVYRPILEQQIPGDVGKRDVVPLLQTKLTTAEMIKYASNAFLATKISFANEIAHLCDFVGADVTEVTAGMGLDTRIGGRFLDAGLGWGGSCFGKDLSALISTAGEYGYRPKLLEGAVSVNESQRKYVVDSTPNCREQTPFGSSVATHGGAVTASRRTSRLTTKRSTFSARPAWSGSARSPSSPSRPLMRSVSRSCPRFAAPMPPWRTPISRCSSTACAPANIESSTTDTTVGQETSVHEHCTDTKPRPCGRSQQRRRVRPAVDVPR
jgi:hypothetical protein